MKTERIALLVVDVDGTLTDGTLYLGKSGECFKAFNVKDGFALAHLLPEAGIQPVVITGRSSEITTKRCEELGIRFYFQGISDKTIQLQSLFSTIEQETGKALDFCNTAYIGDDLNDYSCMEKCALRGCPADAVENIRKIADYVCTARGGRGAVREFAEWILASGSKK